MFHFSALTANVMEPNLKKSKKNKQNTLKFSSG